MDVLNQEFARLLANSGWRQSEAARHLELSPAVVTRYLNQDTRPSLTVLKLFKLLIGDMQPLPGEHDQSVPASVLDRPLDAAERQLIFQLRALDDKRRRRVVQGVCTVLAAFEENPSLPEIEIPVAMEGTQMAVRTNINSTAAPGSRAGGAKAPAERVAGATPKPASANVGGGAGGSGGRKGGPRGDTGGR
jgi:hypothetical protein